MAGAVRWRPAGAEGTEWGEITLSGTGEAWRIRVVLVRLDPARLRFETRDAMAPDGTPTRWTIDSAGPDAVVALNAGQFTSQGPWGWLVRAGRERRAPGRGTLAPAFVVDTGGRVALVPADSLAALRASGTVREAFQSYPALLVGDGELPAALRLPDLGVDLDHRDARLALGLMRDGRVLLALTRFEGLGGVLSNLPFGLTTPEIAAVMGALGCSRAMLLDGGISSQLRVRDFDGGFLAWPGFRRVPLGLVALPR
ncbi:MAG: phosphodiester glycosidase family protein [Gemmatimonadales bacterium]|nr:phosphodiester glycosidase family protein [Gemmatimonadales bacterium]